MPLSSSLPAEGKGREKRNYKSSLSEDDSPVIFARDIADGCAGRWVLQALRHLVVCVCASRDYSLTWDEGADGLEIAQSGREKRVVAMMEWSRRAGWMDGRRDCQMQERAYVCVYVCPPLSLLCSLVFSI